MTLNQIKYMVKVAEYGSINKVASMSFVSQSVISTAIKNLEQELGRSLFIRTAKGVVLTPFGKTFLAYITPICEQIRLIDNMVYQKGRQANQRLRIASNGYNFLSMFLKDIYNKYNALFNGEDPLDLVLDPVIRGKIKLRLERCHVDARQAIVGQHIDADRDQRVVVTGGKGRRLAGEGDLQRILFRSALRVLGVVGVRLAAAADKPKGHYQSE